MHRRIHVITTVNASQVQRVDGRIVIRDVVPVVDDIVMNQGLYPASELKRAFPSLNQVPAPAGHPKDAEGNFLSARDGQALASNYIGAYCTNARHTSGRVLVDIMVNEDQANAMADGKRLVDRLNAAMDGEDQDPIHVSTGLFCNRVEATGESAGKGYSWVATDMAFDHVAILLNEQGAGTPEQGVGMWLNSDDGVETAVLEANSLAADKRDKGLMRWLKSLLSNSSELSFDEIYDKLRALLPEPTYQNGERGYCYLVAVYSSYFIYSDNGEMLFKQGYYIDDDGVVSLTGERQQVEREIEFKPVSNREEVDTMKEHILAALNAAGVSVEGKGDSEILAAYNALITKPVQDKLTGANSKIAEFEQTANATKDAELTALATPLAANSSLTIDELKGLGIDRLKELSAKAAPVQVGNSGSGADALAYLNDTLPE